LATGRVGHANNRALTYVRMLENNLLDLLAGNIITGAHDHVVGARMVPKKAVGIGMEGIPRQVPSIDDISLLSVGIVQITAADRSTHRKTPNLARRYWIHRFIDDHDLITGERNSRRARTDTFARNADERMQHLGRAHEVEYVDSGSSQ